MKYINFITAKSVISEIQGSKKEEITQLENELGFRIPLALSEYLMLMGEKTIYNEYDYHGTKEIKYMHEWIGEWIERYKNNGLDVDELGTVLPFDKFQDTFFYISINEGNENPPVYAFDLNDTPTIRKLYDRFTDFVKWKYEEKLKEIPPSS